MANSMGMVLSFIRITGGMKEAGQVESPMDRVSTSSKNEDLLNENL